MTDGSRESDAALVARANKGDRAAFGSLVQRYQKAVCAIAYGRLGDLEAAYDVSQEAFLVTFEGLRGLRNASKFGPWLRRITRRLCSRWRRSESYRQSLKQALRLQGTSGEEKSPADMLEAEENGAMLRQAIEELPATLREALVLYYYQGQSQAETAACLGISPAAAQVRVARAKRRLRETVAAEIERRLPETAPGRDFTQSTLAAIPTGSICVRLGLNVTRLAPMEAVRQLAHAGAQKATTILTGGGTVMTSKQVVIGGAAAVLLAASVATNVALLLSREAGPEQAAASAVTEEDLAAATAKAEKALAEKGELSQKIINLQEDLERQKKSTDAAWQSRQALANELATLEGKLGEELARLQGPERQDAREPGEKGPEMTRSWVLTRSNALMRLDKVSRALDKYLKERETFPASLSDLVGPYLEDQSAIIDPSTGDVFEYESGWNAGGGQYYEIKSAEGTRTSGTVSPDGTYTERSSGDAPPGEGSTSSPSPVSTPPPTPHAS